MPVSLSSLLVSIIVNIIILSPALWLAGRAIVGGRKARFIDAVMIIVVGLVIGAIVSYVVSGLLAAVIQLLVWLALIKHYFDASWGKALIIAIIAAVIFIVVSAILTAVLGLAAFTLLT
jgi:hypothetical protein